MKSFLPLFFARKQKPHFPLTQFLLLCYLENDTKCAENRHTYEMREDESIKEATKKKK
jgi:hypothetical protein